MRRTYQHRDLYKHLTMLMILALSMCVKVRASSARTFTHIDNASASAFAQCDAASAPSALAPNTFAPSAFVPSSRQPHDAANFPLQLFLVGEVPESLGVTPQQVERALVHAAKQWSDVPCSAIEIVYAGRTDKTDGFAANEIPVEFRNSRCHEVPGEPLLAAAPCGDGGGIVANPDYQWTLLEDLDYIPLDELGFPTAYDLKAVMTHELGHVLGLSHPPAEDEPLATMYPAYVMDGHQAFLDADDRAGICFLYPRDGAEETCTSDADCIEALENPGAACVTIEGFSVCQKERGELGDYCSSDLQICPGVCLFTSATANTGFCTQTCDEASTTTGCPRDWSCQSNGVASFCHPPSEALSTGCEMTHKPKGSEDGTPSSLPFGLLVLVVLGVRRHRTSRNHSNKIT